MSNTVDSFLNRQLVEAGEWQREEQADPAVKGHECLAIGTFDFVRSSFDRGGIGNAPVRRHRLARPDRAYFLRGVVADGEDEVHLRRAGSSELVPTLAVQSMGGQVSPLDFS